MITCTIFHSTYGHSVSLKRVNTSFVIMLALQLVYMFPVEILLRSYENSEIFENKYNLFSIKCALFGNKTDLIHLRFTF